MFPPWTVTSAVTVADIYNTDQPAIPEGWEAEAFRPPVGEENWLNRHNGKVMSMESALYDARNPRIVLKRKELSFEVGDCYKGECSCYRVTGMYSNWAAYQVLSGDGRISNQTKDVGDLRISWKDKKRITRSEWTAEVIKRCCSFGTGGAE